MHLLCNYLEEKKIKIKKKMCQQRTHNRALRKLLKKIESIFNMQLKINWSLVVQPAQGTTQGMTFSEYFLQYQLAIESCRGHC